MHEMKMKAMNYHCFHFHFQTTPRVLTLGVVLPDERSNYDFYDLLRHGSSTGIWISQADCTSQMIIIYYIIIMNIYYCVLHVK